MKKYKLKDDVNIVDFLGSAKKCNHDVNFVTDEGDCINLKSTLAQYIFAVAVQSQEVSVNGYVQCEDDDYNEILKDFMI